MRHALDEATGLVERSQNSSFTYSPVQIKRAVCCHAQACTGAHPAGVSAYAARYMSLCLLEMRIQVEAFIEKKSDLSDAPGAWYAYRTVLRMYTNVTLAAWEHGAEDDATAAPLLAQELSTKSMRHSAVFGADKQIISSSEKLLLATAAQHGLLSDGQVSTPPVTKASGSGRTATLRPDAKRCSKKINYSVNEEDLEARMDTQL